MNYLRLTVFLLLLHCTTFAQSGSKETATTGEWQAGLFGGLSFPLGEYKTLPEKSKFNFTAGLFADHYFKNSRFGLGADIRYLQHGLSKFDPINFANGNISRTDYNGKPVSKEHFKYTAFTVGPTYKIVDGSKWQVEAFLRGGIVLQHFAVYQKTLSYTNGAVTNNFIVAQAANDKQLPSWAGLGGLRFTRMLSNQWGLFLQPDYIRSFGKAWSGDNNRFTTDYQTQLKPINSSTTITDPVADGYYTGGGFANTKSANMQALNITIGIKYIFRGRKAEPEKDPTTKTPEVLQKHIQITVRDKYTGQVLENVTVTIAGTYKTYSSVTKSSGEAERAKNVVQTTYVVKGVRNGVETAPLEITPKDFENNSGPVIYREIYLEDPRFVLKGVTIGCESGKPIAGINAVLKNTKTNDTVSAVSDANGNFNFMLDANANYTLVANQKGKFSQTELVTTNGLSRSATLYVTLNLKLCDIAKDKVFELKNILYDFDKDNIRPDAALILDNVVSVLQQNPTLEIELSSHTDSRGKDLYNMDLSDRRAKSAVAYIVGKGIDKNRLQAKGYGETKLLNKCSNGVSCTEEEHQQNRRTEIKVLKF
ncbi:MAG: OmpA family protein [Chitinophagaceae bacterium]